MNEQLSPFHKLQLWFQNKYINNSMQHGDILAEFSAKLGLDFLIFKFTDITIVSS